MARGRKSNSIKQSDFTNSTNPQDLERRLFVGNLPTDHMTREEMEEIFSKYGKIRALSMYHGYGFVQYDRLEDVQAALDGEKGRLYKGYRLDINKAVERRNMNKASSRSSPTRSQTVMLQKESVCSSSESPFGSGTLGGMRETCVYCCYCSPAFSFAAQAVRDLGGRILLMFAPASKDHRNQDISRECREAAAFPELCCRGSWGLASSDVESFQCCNKTGKEHLSKTQDSPVCPCGCVFSAWSQPPVQSLMYSPPSLDLPPLSGHSTFTSFTSSVWAATGKG